MITFEKLDSAGFASRYSVLVDGEVRGEVGSRHIQSYRKYGRLRYPTGNPLRWAFGTRGLDPQGFYYNTRKEAVGALLREGVH